MKILGALALATALLGCTTAPAADPPAPPSLHPPVSEVGPNLIAHFERRIVMPPGAQPLAEYDRYCAMERINDRNIVRGVLLLRSAYGDIDRGGMTPVEGLTNVYHGAPDDIPIVADGGCAVVVLYFDTLSYLFRQLEANEGDHVARPAICNGRA